MTTKDCILKASLMALVSMAGLLASCSSDDDSTEPQRRITVEVCETPMADASEQAHEGVTRATATTTATLSEFSMRGLTTEYTVKKNADNTWSINPNRWPSGANGNVIFYAYTGGTFNPNNGNPYIRFTMAENASTQHDLLVAKNQASTPSDGVGKVSLTFSHACAAVAFRVQITKTLSNQLGSMAKLTVNSIRLCNVYNDGKYYFNTGWSNVKYATDVRTYYTLSNSSFDVGTDFLDLSSNDLFVIPQNRTADSDDMCLEINYGNNKTTTIPIKVDWQAGYRYTIGIRLGTQQISLS